MASEKKNGTKDFDISKFLPEGFSNEEFVTIGGLRPIVTPAIQFEKQSIVVGLLLGWVPMPPRPSDGSEWDAILVKLTGPTLALAAGEETIEAKAGETVLIPVGGNLGNNHELYAASCDPKNVHLAIFAVTGQIKVNNQPSKMWSYDVKLHRKSIPRTHETALVKSLKPTSGVEREPKQIEAAAAQA
jgi:hypothetical protein